jgi:hypothetical protein
VHRFEAVGRNSGGRSLSLSKFQDIDALSSAFNREVGSSYYLSFKPLAAQTERGKVHHIEVKVRNAKWKVLQSRIAYVSSDPVQ